MKCTSTLTNFILFILFINHLTRCRDIQINSSNFHVDKQKLVQCKLCQEMFELNFNYEDLLKSNKIQTVKKAFDPLQERPDELKAYFSKENMEFITKEISLQYFFKGADTQLYEVNEVNQLTFKDCKTKKVGLEGYECDQIKLQACDKVLNYEDGICSNLQNHLKTIMGKLIKKKKTNLIFNSNLNDKKSHVPHSKSGEDTIINFKKFHFKQREDIVEHSDDVARRFGDFSLLEIAPEYE